jgi:uncharacterized protein YjbJ (UPF0337 family)
VDWNRVERNWKHFKGKVREKWSNLTNDELERVAGRRDYLEAIIQQAYGADKIQVTRDIDRWLECQRV